MKELTVAQGQLRCGECDNVFDAMDTLSTTLPKKQALEANAEEVIVDPDVLKPKYTRPKSGMQFSMLHVLTVVFLLSLLAIQFLYTNKTLITDELQRQPDQVKMVSRNVISHPNDKGVLLISASIENKAETAQPYPFVEVTLQDDKENTIALRRFKPEEYLQRYSANEVMEPNKEAILRLKISDPGETATRFNFKFM